MMITYLYSIHPLESSRISGLRVSDGYDSSPLGIICGFGFDESTYDYKVVGVLSVLRNHNFHHHEVSIYSLKSISWRSKDEIPDGVQLKKPCKFFEWKDSLGYAV